MRSNAVAAVVAAWLVSRSGAAQDPNDVATFRYWLAVALVCTLAPFLLYWPIVHGLIHVWRRLGPRVALVLLLGATLAGAAVLFGTRERLLLVDYGTNWALVAVGLSLLAAAAWLRVEIHKVFPNTMLLGMPELDPDHQRQRLVRSGIYGRVRHPRYAQFVVALGATRSSPIIWALTWSGSCGFRGCTSSFSSKSAS